MRVQVLALPAFHVAYMRYVGPYGPHGIPALWLYRGDPNVDAATRRFRCELCLPVRPL